MACNGKQLLLLMIASILVTPVTLAKKKAKVLCYDYIVVGAGGAGCPLAAKLSDPVDGKFKNSVLVLEAGENLSSDPRVFGANNIFTAIAEANDPAISTIFLTYPLGQEVNPFFAYGYTEGRVLGGSTAHNYLQVNRATPAELHTWAVASGNDRWEYNNLLNTVIKPLEHYVPDGTIANPAQRGFNGPCYITQEPFQPLAQDPFYQGVSAALGVPIVTDYNDPDQGVVGISTNQDSVTPPFLAADSIRSYAGNAFLTGEPAQGIPAIIDFNGNGLNGRKLKVLFNAHASRVIFSNDKIAEGVEYIIATDRDEVITARARKGIILTAGGISDPAILQRSGIGDPTLLKSLGIPVVFANPNVGANMQTPVGQQGFIGGVSSLVNEPALGTAWIGFEPAPQERQFLLNFFNGYGAFPGDIALALGLVPGIAVIGANFTPKSEGSVKIISRDPFIQPLINLNFFSDEEGSDINKVVEFYNLLQDIAQETGGTVLYPTPDMYAAGTEGLVGAALSTLLPYNHISCTCRMSTSPATGVVDGTLRVFGVKNLMVASSSAEPITTGGQHVAAMLGIEAARIIRGE